MLISEMLSQGFGRNHWLIHQQTKGLTHADSLLQLPFRGNCMNWILGHVLVSRDEILEMLGEQTLMSEAARALYRRESDPLRDTESAIKLDQLLESLDESQDRLKAALKRATSEELEISLPDHDDQTLEEYIEFLAFHETYHIGQLEILRQLAGADDKII